jgi:uncharacterized protein (TIGR02145 family)
MGRAEGATLSFTTIDYADLTTSAITASGKTTATLQATLTHAGGGTVSATGFKYSTSPTLAGASTIAGNATSGTFSSAVSGLTVHTTYYYASYATNEAGTAYGDTLSFTTWNACDNVTSYAYDGHTYALAGIGSQCWFAENLRTDQYSDGFPMMNNTNETYHAANLDPNNVATYGYLYAVGAGIHGMCPSGWRLPATTDFDVLNAAVSNNGIALMSTAWNGNNSSGFNARPGGKSSHSGTSGGNVVTFINFGTQAYFGTTTTSIAYKLDGTSAPMTQEGTSMGPMTHISIRCLKN